MVTTSASSMPTTGHRIPSPRDLFRHAPTGGTNWALAGIAIAIAIGAIATLGTTALILLAIVIIAPLVVMLWGATMTDVLIASVFLEAVSFGGLTLSRLLAPVALLVVVVALIRRRLSFHPGPLIVPVAAYTLWAIASGIWSVSLPHTMEILGSLGIALVYMVSFATLIHDERDMRRTFTVLAAASMLIGLVSIASFAGTPILATESLQGGRSQGGVGDPNFFANVQLVALPIILLMAAEAKSLMARIFFGFATIVAITSVFSTLSRGALIALVVVALILPFIPAQWLMGSQRQKKALLLILALAVGGLFTRPAFRSEVVSRVQTLFASQGADAAGGGSSAGSGRTELWKAAFTTIEERPLIGLGLGAFPSQSNQLLFRSPGVKLDLIATHPDGIEAHSAYIGTAADLGFVGLGALLGIILTIFASLARLAARARRAGAVFCGRVATALTLSMVGWVISSAFIETETARPLWIVIGLTFVLGKIVARAELERGRPG